MQKLCLANFSQIRLEDVPGKLEELIKYNLTVIEQLSSKRQVSWQSLIQPMEELDDKLNQFWSPISHLNSVKNSAELRKVYQKCLPMLSNYSTEIGQNEPLFNAINEIKKTEYNSLAPAQQKVIDNELRDFRLAGVDLAVEKKQRYKTIQTKLSELCNQFENNVLDATNKWTIQITDEARLSGLPEHARQAAKEAAQAKELDGWLFTLEFPSYYAVISYADDEALREEMYTAYVTRASDQGPNANEFDNSAVMDEILSLRHEKAQLVGFNNYAEYSLATKMAEKSEDVLHFLNDLAKRCKEQGKKEFDELTQFAKTEFNIATLNPWDISYYSEKLRLHKYDISQEALRPYFPENKVIKGLFEIVERLYGIRLQERSDVDTWHEDVRYFDVLDENGAVRGGLYFDLYARAKKRGGAWMDECVNRRRLEDEMIQAPVAFLTCNFSGPTKGQPAIFTHNEVVTLFHELGHCLHHLLTQVDYSFVSGINGVPWDAVELPSQFFENWAWDKTALDLCAQHYQTGEPLPDDMFQRLLNAKNFQSAMQMLRQLEFSLFDFSMHCEYEPELGGRIQEKLNAVREKVTVVPVPEFNCFQNSFSHIFAGGYAAGYYSYKWAEVLSSDAFSLFEENGIFDQATGRSFLHNILEKGGSQEPMDLFVAFRGRKPTVDALLKHSGIV